MPPRFLDFVTCLNSRSSWMISKSSKKKGKIYSGKISDASFHPLNWPIRLFFQFLQKDTRGRPEGSREHDTYMKVLVSGLDKKVLSKVLRKKYDDKFF